MRAIEARRVNAASATASPGPAPILERRGRHRWVIERTIVWLA
jgi:hypothetical protein